MIDLLSRPIALALIVAVAALCVLPGLGTPGLWEPLEIAVADEAIARADGTYAAPTAPADCPAGADPDGAGTFTARSAAWGIRNLAGDDLGARIPLAVLGILGVAATVLVGWRLGSWRAGALGGIVQLSFPLWAMQARQFNGEIGTATGATLMIYGLVALARPRPEHARGVARWIDLATAGSAILIGAHLAFHSGGALLGLLPPILGIAVAGELGLPALGAATRAAWRAMDRRGARPVAAPVDRSGGGVAMAATAIAIGLIVVLVGQIYDLGPLTVGTRQIGGRSILENDCWSSLLGGVWRKDEDLRSTYDAVFEQAAFGMYPWSMLAPIALAALAAGLAGTQRRWAGAVLLGWAAFGWIAATAMDRKVGFAIFPAFPACALAIGLWLDAVLDERAAADRDSLAAEAQARRALHVIGFIVLLGALVLGKDLAAFPERLTSLLVGDDQVKYPANTEMFGLPLNKWLLPLGLAAVIPLTLSLWLWRPAATAPAWYARWRGADIANRGIPVALALTIVLGVFWPQVWHRRLSVNLSSKHVFQVYNDLRRAGDELGILGSMGNAPRYYAEGEWKTLTGRDQLLELLRHPNRVFALAPATELCAIHRARAEGLSYHVIDDNNARTLLLSNQLAGGADRNPLAAAIRREPPANLGSAPAVTWDNAIELVGVDMPRRVARGSSFDMTLVFKVVAPISGSWKILAHFDQRSSRFNGDHDPIRGRCATSQWQVGDYIVDTFRVDAGNSGFGNGPYDVWLGFFTGTNPNWRNMSVTHAADGVKDSNNRVKIGTITLTSRRAGCNSSGASDLGSFVALLALAGPVLRRRRTRR